MYRDAAGRRRRRSGESGRLVGGFTGEMSPSEQSGDGYRFRYDHFKIKRCKSSVNVINLSTL